MKTAVLNHRASSGDSVRQAAALLLLLAFPFEQVLQAGPPVLPSGGTFTAGSGSIATSNNALLINQTSGRAIIDWNRFSIGAGGKVMFANGVGATLNRVTGDQMSTILGSLQSSGSVYLINPQGVLIGPGGRIKTGGDFVASTLQLPAGTFLSGGALVFEGSSPAFVKNLGSISSTGGSIFLIANQVSNSGSLSAANGTAGMAAGGQVLLKDSSGDQRVFVKVSGGDATNTGRIDAAQVELKANGGNIYALAGNNGGEIRATGTATLNGHAWLISEGGTTKVNSTLSARNQNGQGGFIETSGHTVDIGATSIRAGNGGSWLVDPVDLTIDSAAASTIQGALGAGTNVVESTSSSSSSGYGTTATGSGDINVASGISWSSSASLTLNAYRNINFADGVSIAGSGAGNLTLHADNEATGTGTVNFNSTGNLNFTGAGNVDLFYHPAAYPTATNFTSKVTMGSGTFTPYMTVDTATDLQNISNNVAGKYALNTDIDASSISNFVPIAHGASYTNSSQGFSGLFDGKGHTISNLTMNNTTDSTAGLFAQTSSAGSIRNVGLENVSVQSTVDNSSVGGLAGVNYGSISTSYVTGSISTAGNGNVFVGGFTGENEGTITNSYSRDSVTALTNSGCNGCIYIGGFVGENGYINGSAAISNSLSMGAVGKTGPASATIGGFAGENDAYINNSYFDTQTSGQVSGYAYYYGFSNSIGGRTTAQLQDGTLPSGFSSTYWTASAGAYPTLGWQVPPGISVTGIVYNGATPLGSVTVVGLANGASFGSTTTNGSGAYTLLAPSGTTGVLTYLTGGYAGNTFSNKLSPAFSGVDIYANSLRLINATNNNYTGILTALSSALGSNSGSNFLFTLSGGNLSLTSGANFALSSTVATAIDQSIAGTGTVLLQSSGDLTINASKTISASGSGTPLTVTTGGTFTNNAGSGALSVSGGGRWLVYSQNPANDQLGSLGYSFKQYNATYGSTSVAQSSGNGVLYTLAPSLTPSLTGSSSKQYDGTTTAPISAANLTSSGALSGDTVTVSSSGATFANQNAGSSKSVTATGVTASATDATSATVYGYQLSSTSASGNIGTITPAQLTYAANSANRSYGSSNPSFTGSVTGFVNSETLASATSGAASFTSPATATSNIGSYAINGSGLTATNGNYTFTQASGNATALTIDPAILTYTANAGSRSYGALNPSFTGSVTGFVNSETLASATTGAASFTSPATATSNVGSYAVNGSGLSANNGNYTFQQAAGNATALTISPAALTYTASSASRSYGASNPSFTGTVTGFVNSETLASATTGSASFTTPASATSNFGSYAVNGSGLSAINGNYTFQQAAGNATALTIDPAALTYTASSASRSYGAPSPSFSGTVTGFVNGDTLASTTTGTASYSSSATAASNVGSYAINGSGLTANGGNYTFQQAAGNASALTIDPAVLTFTANAGSRSYGASNPSFTGTVTGFVNSETLASATTGAPSFTSPATATSNVGSYAVNGSGVSANNGNYTFQQALGNATALTINPAALTYAASSANRSYGASNPSFSGTVTGFVNGETLASATTGAASFTSAANSTSNVGSYAINDSGLSANNGNYTFQQAAGNATALTIDPAALTYTANAAGRSYGASNPSFTGTVSGFVNGDTLASITTGSASFNSSANVTSKVGAYAINGSGLTANSSNYVFQQAPGNATALTINPAALTSAVLANDKIYDATTAATGQLSALEGVLNNDDVSLNVFATNYSFGDKNVGTAKPVTATGTALNGSSAPNYTLKIQPGTAAITPASLKVALSASDKTYDGSKSASGSLSGLSGVLGTDSVSLDASHAVYAFADAASGTGKAVVPSGVLLAGNDAANYRLFVRNGTASIDPAPVTVQVSDAIRPVGTPNPTFTATYSGQAIDGIDLNALLSSVLFTTPAGAGAGPGLYTIAGNGTYPNVNLNVLPGTLTVTAVNTPRQPSPVMVTPNTPPPAAAIITVNTPQSNPALVTAKPPASPVLLPGLNQTVTVSAPNSLGVLQLNYSTNWSLLLGPLDDGAAPLASSSFLTNGASSNNTYQGGIRQ